MGAGPFFTADHIELQDVRYLGRAADIDLSVAIGYWGELQIEIIRQHNDTPSIYSSWRNEGSEGLHHVCIVADDMNVVRKACNDAGARIVQEGKVPGSGSEFLYADTGGGPGTLLEVLTPGPGNLELFAMMRDAARNWDGTGPVRKLR